MDVAKLCRKLTEHENELKRLNVSEVNAKKIEKMKEEKRDIFVKTLPSKTMKVENDSESSDGDSSKE